MTPPAPLVPPEVDLRDFAFMPLDVARLRDSELAASESPEACWAAVLLWAASWHQVPAASVPNDDKWLAKAAGYGRVVKEWMRVKEGAMRGFVECSDGRLYHPVVAEKAADAWTGKLAQSWRTECARIKKHNQRHEMNVPLPDFDRWRAAGCPQGQPLPVPEDKADLSQGQAMEVPRETPSNRQGEGQGQGQGLEEEKTSSSSSAEPTAGQQAGPKVDQPAAPKPTVPCPYRDIVAAYHEALPTLPRVRVFDGKLWDGRCKAMRELWGWVLSSRRADESRRATNADEAMTWIRDYFARAAMNDFVMGRTPRSAQHANWRCDIDFLLTKAGLKQVLEKTEAAA